MTLNTKYMKEIFQVHGINDDTYECHGCGATTGLVAVDLPNLCNQELVVCTKKCLPMLKETLVHIQEIEDKEAAKHPEHQKLSAIREQSQRFGDFLEWLKNNKKFVLAQRYPIAEYDPETEEYYPSETETELAPCGCDTNKLLAEYFNIDLMKLEAEKRSMLDEIRKHNEGLVK